MGKWELLPSRSHLRQGLCSGWIDSGTALLTATPCEPLLVRIGKVHKQNDGRWLQWAGGGWLQCGWPLGPNTYGRLPAGPSLRTVQNIGCASWTLETWSGPRDGMPQGGNDVSHVTSYPWSAGRSVGRSVGRHPSTHYLFSNS